MLQGDSQVPPRTQVVLLPRIWEFCRSGIAAVEIPRERGSGECQETPSWISPACSVVSFFVACALLMNCSDVEVARMAAQTTPLD